MDDARAAAGPCAWFLPLHLAGYDLPSEIWKLVVERKHFLEHALHCDACDAWTLDWRRCSSCSRPGVVCAAAHENDGLGGCEQCHAVQCSDCSGECQICYDRFCSDCTITCWTCSFTVCRDHDGMPVTMRPCATCLRDFCGGCSGFWSRCPICAGGVCDDCAVYCKRCMARFCARCLPDPWNCPKCLHLMRTMIVDYNAYPQLGQTRCLICERPLALDGMHECSGRMPVYRNVRSRRWSSGHDARRS